MKMSYIRYAIRFSILVWAIAMVIRHNFTSDYFLDASFAINALFFIILAMVGCEQLFKDRKEQDG